MEEIFSLTPADYAVYGEGEHTFSDLIFHLRGELPISAIDGIMYKSSSGCITTNPPRKQIHNLDNLPFPAYDLFHMDRYPLHRIATSRGCPYKCSFCNSTSIWDNHWRKRSAENVIDEIEFIIKKYKKKTFSFNDNSFNIDINRVHLFCDLIIERDINILWSTPVRVENISIELAQKMKSSGCYNVGIGIESANNGLLDRIGKKISIAKISESIHIFKEAGIEVLGQFVIGSPGETLETVKESLAFAKQSELDFVMFYSVLPFKGTPQWEYVKTEGAFFSETIHDYHSVKPRVVFETSEFSLQDRITAINLATEAGYYCDTNDKSVIFDICREFVKKIQNHLPSSISNNLYLLIKNIYRKNLRN